MVEIPWFIAGLAVGILLAIGVRYILPSFFSDANTRRLQKHIRELEDRLERKDEMIRKAIKASGEKA